MTVDLRGGDVRVHDGDRRGLDACTSSRPGGTRTPAGASGGCAHRLSDGTFMLTYGDGVANVDLDALLAFHQLARRLATVTAVRPPARFGGLTSTATRSEFSEKPQIGEGWINGGFMVLEPQVLDYIPGDGTASNPTRWSSSRRRASCVRSHTRASGRRWTRCARSGSCGRCGAGARRLG